MAQVFGLTGKIKGKYGNSVFRIRRGTQVMASYNPVVDNPNTDKQVNARARFKLISQLASILAPIIAIPRDGAVTARNLFTRRNYRFSASVEGKASIQLPQVQLTDSNREMPRFSVSRSNGTSIMVALQQAAVFDRVAYAVVAKNANENLRVFASAVVNNGNNGGADTFAASLPFTDEAIVVYAYAINDTNARAKAAFGNIVAPTAEEIATLIASRSVNSSDYIMTATGGAYLEVGTADAVSVDLGDGSQGGTIPTRPTIGGYTPFSEYTEVVISAQEGATIHYTTDGSNPTAASAVYSEPIRIDATTTIKAIAIVDGVSSDVTTKTLTKTSAPVSVQAPVINGTTPFSQSTTVSITAEAGATIHYTTDGSEPTAASRAYDEPFQLTATTTIKAVAVLQNTLSAVTTRTFTKGGNEGPEGE